MNSSEICIIQQTDSSKSDLLSDKLDIPLCQLNPPDSPVWLDWILDKQSQQQKLALCSKATGPVLIDFLSGKKAHRRKFGGGKNQPLARAMGSTPKGLPSIIDATAGMAGDSYVLASLGFKVDMLERSAIVSALLEDALDRALHEKPNLSEEEQLTLDRLNLIKADSIEYLLNEKPNVDVIYLDPMYPEKKKKAAVKKEMQALQLLAGPDIDSSKLLDAALQTANYRVVVKRPKGAEPVQGLLNEVAPTTNINSPNTRYDIYVIKALKEQIN